jgi:hypothetical protein
MATVDLNPQTEKYFHKPHFSQPAVAGGSSVRTWGADRLDRILANAHRHELTVCVGLWLGHPRYGFDYQHETTITRQLGQCLEVVRKYKSHPAMLLWGIGNEMEGDGRNPAIWYAIDHIAREIRQLDPRHPTMTEFADRSLQHCSCR